MGPSYQDCVDYYTSISSPIIRDNVLTDTHSSAFIGSQSFRAPRVIVYNVTIAGAAGGTGLCNSEYGRGLVQHTSFIPPNTSFVWLILVGQRGLGPCETGEPDPEHILCQNPPLDLEESANCSEAYHQWLQTLNDADTEESILSFSGGAGGGGASFLGFRDSRPELDIRAVGISGGGGGSSVLLNISVIQDLLPALENNTLNDSTLYRDLLNANSTTNNLVNDIEDGFRGYRVESDITTAGVGGGVTDSVDYQSTQADGRAIGHEKDFALGGTHCAANDFSSIPLQLRGGDGGFGGGGGGCGGGGGGGGFTGGAVLGDTNTTPGGGGYSFNSASCNTAESCSVPPGSYTYNTEVDGYVDIVAADCGCVYECVVYEEDDQFECLCPNDTQLAPDLSDCYYSELCMNPEHIQNVSFMIKTFFTPADEREVTDIDWILSFGDGYQFKRLVTGNTTLLYSMSTVLRTEKDNISCAVLFLGKDRDDVVLISEPVRYVIGKHIHVRITTT